MILLISLKFGAKLIVKLGRQGNSNGIIAINFKMLAVATCVI